METKWLCSRRGAYQPFLERYGRNLTAEAIAGALEPVVGRNDVLQRMAHILLRRTKNNPILLGDPGVGKTAVVEALATMLATGAVRVYPAFGGHAVAVPPHLAEQADCVSSCKQSDAWSSAAGFKHASQWVPTFDHFVVALYSSWNFTQ